jgi:hypothetical protein
LNALSDIKLRTVLPASRLGLLLMSECTVLVLMAFGAEPSGVRLQLLNLFD